LKKLNEDSSPPAASMWQHNATVVPQILTIDHEFQMLSEMTDPHYPDDSFYDEKSLEPLVNPGACIITNHFETLYMEYTIISFKYIMSFFFRLYPTSLY
jgi:hypothetical protein